MESSKQDTQGQLKHGLSKAYFKDGKLSHEGEYVHGEKTGSGKYMVLTARSRAAKNINELSVAPVLLHLDQMVKISPLRQKATLRNDRGVEHVHDPILTI